MIGVDADEAKLGRSQFARAFGPGRSAVEPPNHPGLNTGSGSVGDDALELFAEAFDAEADGVAGAEKHRGLAAHADSARCAGGDHVAGVEREELAEVADQLSHGEDHRRGVAVLHALVVHFEPEAEILRVGDFVLRDEPGSERAESVAAFAFVPETAAVLLERALGNVV